MPEEKTAKSPKKRTSAKPVTPNPRAPRKPVARLATPASRLDILMVVSEARPFAKTGGLADVAGALPAALARLGHRVTVVLPRYRGSDVSGAARMDGHLPFGPNGYRVVFHEKTLDDRVTAVLIDASDLYDREGLYGDARGEYADNAFRFAVLSRGALEYARLRGSRPSVIHAHDWQAALVPVYAKTELGSDPIVGGVRTVLTIHNLAFQGLFNRDVLRWMNIGDGLYHPGALEFWGRASSLKGGIVFSDAITTVSAGYAREILSSEFGFGFDGILRNRAADLVGILNGIDTQTWNPETDRHLPERFSINAMEGKRAAKQALLEAVGLPADADALARPLVGIISRLTYQKGFELALRAGDRLFGSDVSWVVLGNGEPHYERFWTDAATRHRRRVSATIGFDDHLAHLIEGGSDMFLMPSWYEPCGLNQMYSLRYGTLPIVRATGGLDDTVHDGDEDPARGTGFKFRDFSADAMVDAIGRALAAYVDRPRWAGMQRRAMAEDHSWDVSAREYVKVLGGLDHREDGDGIRQGSNPDGRQLRPGGQRRKTGSR
jgi:starch synthase